MKEAEKKSSTTQPLSDARRPALSEDAFWNLCELVPPRRQADPPRFDTTAAELDFGDAALHARVQGEAVPQMPPEKSAHHAAPQKVPEKAAAAATEGIDAIDVKNDAKREEKTGENAAPTPLDSAAQAQALFEKARPVACGVPLTNRRVLHTPADVRPPMCEAVLQYVPQHPFLRSVSISRWPQRYRFFDRFLNDAKRFWNREAPPCPYEAFYAYMPQYHMMSAAQAQYYFYWRACVRRGEYLQTDYSYLFLYCYEIINLPQLIKPAQGLAALCALWLAYRERFTRLDRYLGEWVTDYCLIHRLDAPLDVLGGIVQQLLSKVSLKEFYILPGATPAGWFTPSLCDALSNYDWRQSKYCTREARPLFIQHLYGAVQAFLTVLMQEKEDISAALGLQSIVQNRDAFSGALCSYEAKRQIRVELVSLSRSYEMRCMMSDAYKFAENGIRAHLGIRARLSTPALSEAAKEAMRRYFDEHLPSAAKRAREEKKRQAQAETEPRYAALYETEKTPLSAANARRIERDSWKTTVLLIGEEAPQTAQDPPAEKAQAPTREQTTVQADTGKAPAWLPPQLEETLPGGNDVYADYVNALSDAEYEALCAVLEGKKAAFEAAARAMLCLPQTLAQTLNEKAIALTADTALEPDGTGFYHLCDFYANELTDAIIARAERQERT